MGDHDAHIAKLKEIRKTMVFPGIMSILLAAFTIFSFFGSNLMAIALIPLVLVYITIMVYANVTHFIHILEEGNDNKILRYCADDRNILLWYKK